MPSPLLINAAELLRRPGSAKVVDVDVPATEVGVADDPRFANGASLGVRLHLESLSDGVVVDGVIRVPWSASCRRCLASTEGVLASEVHELYQQTVVDPDAFEIVGEQLDLRPMVREVALLDAPLTPLCRPDCAGLCPVCGVDRNHVACGCATETVDPRWEALGELRVELDDR